MSSPVLSAMISIAMVLLPGGAAWSGTHASELHETSQFGTASLPPDQAVIAQTSLGAVKGVNVGHVLQFRGIPYAEPPVGALRFEKTVAKKPWSGILDATRHKAISLQSPARLDAIMGPTSGGMSEDCLTLSVTTPALDGGKRPVVIFIHGGGFLSGAGSIIQYDPSYVSEQENVVFVTINYRLGALGYLYVPGVTEGNYALDDQRAAIQWVRDNIDAFGGDPDDITLMGQSAGAASIACHIVDSETNRLFSKGIILSFPEGGMDVSPESSERFSRLFLKKLGIAALSGADLKNALKAYDAEELLRIQSDTIPELALEGNPNPGIGPTLPEWAYDLDFTKEIAACAIQRGIQIIIGSTHDEDDAFYRFDKKIVNASDVYTVEYFEKTTGSSAMLPLYKALRPGGTNYDLIVDVSTDYLYTLPSLDLAERIGDGGGKVMVYRFDWSAGDPRGKAPHCLELPFLFGRLDNWDSAAMLQKADRTTFETISRAVRNAVFSIVRNENRESWPPYNGAHKNVMVFDEYSGIRNDPSHAAQKMETYRKKRIERGL